MRSDRTWHGYARNVLCANNRDGTFTEISGPAGLDFAQDCRSFALADIDHDGRLEVILKSRNAPQIRILHNAMREIGDVVSFHLREHEAIAMQSAQQSRLKPAICAKRKSSKLEPDSWPSTARNCSLAWDRLAVEFAP